MKILYDLTFTQNREFYSGIYEFGKRIYKDLIAKYPDDVTLLLIKDAPIDEWIKELNKPVVFIDAKFQSNSYWKQIERAMKDFDRVFFPYQIIWHKLNVPSNCELFLTVHDLIQVRLAGKDHLNDQEGLYVPNFKKRLKYIAKTIVRPTNIFKRKIQRNLGHNIKVAKSVNTISDYTKREIIEMFGTDESKIVTLYPPLKIVTTDKESKFDYKNYFLFVSTNRHTKNAYRGIKALDEIYDTNPEFPGAILTGKVPAKVLSKMKHQEKFTSLGYMNVEDLEYLYKNAEALIFPSLAEGFGLPPLEAMKYGTPVVCSGATCLKELYDSTLLFDPYNVNDIKAKILDYKSIKRETMLETYNKIVKLCDEDTIKIVDYLALPLK